MGAGQLRAGAPAKVESGAGESQGSDGLSPGGGAGRGAGPSLAEGGSSEPAPFGGYANPTPTESLLNKARMDALAREIEADSRRGSDFEGGQSYRFVTTKPVVSRHRTDAETGLAFVAISPFHVFDGTRYAIFDASLERPATVTVTSDNKLTISRP
jgi:hypothetical protein